MKRKITLISLLVLTIFSSNIIAQESSWNTGTDLVSSYVWRGTKFGSGPSFQPSVSYSKGGLTIGAWGSYAFSTNEAAEADLYATYEVSLGEKSSLTFAVNDYYFPGSEYFDGDSHYLEPSVSIGLGNFSLAGAYMTNAEDVYFEAGLSLGSVNLFAGAGDGQYTVDAKFSFCNVGLKTSKEIKISDSFSIPVSGSVILNPSTEQFHIVVGISL